MAEEEFRFTGLSPSHAFLMILVNENPGIGQKELCKQLHLAPSTITRFIDILTYKGYVSRESEGKISKIYPTDEGKNLQKLIIASWKSLHQRYSKIIGLEEGNNLAHIIDETNHKLFNIK
jgi:DNA-binding MarR family transcriptional regulator